MSFKKPNPDKWTIYTKSGCPYCLRAKDLLNLNMIEYDLIDCDEILRDPNTKEEFLSYIESRANIKHRTFPIVFNHDVFIGGFDKTTEYINNLNISKNLSATDDF